MAYRSRHAKAHTASDDPAVINVKRVEHLPPWLDSSFPGDAVKGACSLLLPHYAPVTVTVSEEEFTSRVTVSIMFGMILLTP